MSNTEVIKYYLTVVVVVQQSSIWLLIEVSAEFANSYNRTFSYSAKEPGWSVIFVHFNARGSIEWHQSFYDYCAHSKILQNVAKYHSIENLFQNS